MSYGYDYIIGNMKCAFCHCVSDADTRTNLQTKICAHATLASYTIGSKLILDTCIPDCGYVCLIEPKENNSFNFIDFWGCTSCSRANGALIELKDDVIVSINAISSSENIIDGINYISDDYGLYGWDISGKSIIRGVIDI